MNRMRNKIKIALLVPLAFLVAIPFSSIVLPQSASAAGAVDTMTPANQVKAYWYYKAMTACMNAAVNGNDGLALETNIDNIKKGRLVYQHNLANAWVQGYYIEKTEGRTTCSRDDVKVMRDGLTSVYSMNPLEVVCAMGYVRNNNGPCADSSSTENFKGMSENDASASNRAKNFANQLKAKLWGGNEPALSAAGLYELYSKSLINACTTGQQFSGSTSGAQANTIYELKTGADTKVVYTARGDRTHGWGDVYISPNGDVGNSGGEKITCKQALDKANANAAAAVYAQGCITKYKSDELLLAACNTGAVKRAADNGSNARFCYDTYNASVAPGSPSFNVRLDEKRKACYAGYGIAGVDECINKLKYTSGLELQACTFGVMNATNANYCTDPNGISRFWTTNKAGLQQACKDGQALGVAVDTIQTTAVVPEEDRDAGTTTSCVVEGIGWIICPVTNFLANVSDGAFSVVQNFLKVNINTYSTDSGTYVAWSTFRNIANALFVIAFLVIIFSQLTGQGVSNYGVKKTLPRLVITVIFVNVSFFVCQILVDVTQILGGGIITFFQGIPVGTAESTKVASWSDVMGDALMGVGIAALAGAAIVGGAAIVALSISLPVLLAFLLAVLMTVIILIGRQAGIVILMIIAPIAFVAYLLPNTEKWFKRWIKVFWGLLLVYPIVALLYGGGALTSRIIANVANTSPDLDAQTKFWFGIIAIAVSALPLIMTPSLLKGALNATGQMGSMASKFASRANGGVRKSANSSSKYGEAKQGLKNRFALGRATRRGKSSLQNKIDNSRFGKALGLDKGAARALQAVNHESNTEVDNAVIRMSNEKPPHEMLAYATEEFGKAIESGDTVRARAAQKILLGSGNPGRKAVEETYSAKFSKLQSAERSGLSDDLRTDLKNSGLKGASNALSQHAITSQVTDPSDPTKKVQAASFDDYLNDSATFSGLNPVELAGQSTKNLKSIQALKPNTISTETARAVLANTSAAALLDNEKREFFEGIAGAGGVDTHTVINAGTPNQTAVPRNATEIHADLTAKGGAATLSDAELLRIHHHAADAVGKADPGRAPLRAETTAEITARGITYDKKAMRNSTGRRP